MVTASTIWAADESGAAPVDPWRASGPPRADVRERDGPKLHATNPTESKWLIAREKRYHAPTVSMPPNWVGGGVAPTTSYTRKDAVAKPAVAADVSDIRLKHDINLLGHLENGVGFDHFSYNGSTKAFVGVIAQEVQQGSPTGGRVRLQQLSDCELRKLGLKFKSYKQWIASGAHVPKVAEIPH